MWNISSEIARSGKSFDLSNSQPSLILLPPPPMFQHWSTHWSTSWLYTCHHLHIHEMGRMTQNTWRHCYIYSFPRIRSDNGLYFAADVVKQFLLLWGVQPVKHYYTPVNTSIVERAIVTFVHYEESLSFMQSFLNLNYSIKLDVCYQFAFWTDNKFRLRILHHTSRKRGCGSNSPSPSHDELLAIQESFVKVAWDHIFSRYYSHF